MTKFVEKRERRNDRNGANERERCRMKKINHGFDQLRNCLPTSQADPKMSKVRTLRQAIDYIKALESSLQRNSAENYFNDNYERSETSSSCFSDQ